MRTTAARQTHPYRYKMVSLDVLALDTSGRVIILSLIIQELVYERPYMVLPPLIEWLRVTVGKYIFQSTADIFT